MLGTESTIGPFQCKSKKIKNFSELAYSIEKYVTFDKKYYVKVKQSFPQQITTNFFIHAEK